MMTGIAARLACGGAAAAMALAVGMGDSRPGNAADAVPAQARPRAATDLGINLFGLETANREQVFSNLILQSGWFVDTGHGWTPMPADRLDRNGWIKTLRKGEVAPRPLVLPPIPFDRVAVRCTYAGQGILTTGGIAETVGRAPGVLDLELRSNAEPDEGAWIRLDQSDPADPLRDIDCRDKGRSRAELFNPAFIRSLHGFAAVRFLDWQLTNLNRSVTWNTRTRPESANQIGGDGVAIETMIALANTAHVDPWFLMPYTADATYIAGFAKLVRERLAPDRTVYVELGNEMWNDMFEATRQAAREGIAAGLAPAGDGDTAKSLRYAQKTRAAMRIWAQVYADRPNRLVRVLSVQNVEPAMARLMLADKETARSIDALATAPYIHLDMTRLGVDDVDRMFAALPAQVDATIGYAAQTRALAHDHGKRFVAYEGGQHLVTGDLALARAVQRDPRMEAIYRQYLRAWQARIGDRLMLYASTAPIAPYGAWGLKEYAGQAETEAPKLRAVHAFMASSR